MHAMIMTGLATGLLVVGGEAARAGQPGAEGQAPPACESAAGGCAAAMEAEPAQQPARIDAAFGKAWLGAPDGDVTLIVFADYACPACREAQAAIDQLIAAEPKLRIVYRILVNEPEGLQAARTSLAVARMENADWSRFHHALDAGGTPTAKAIAAALAAAGIDSKRLPPLDDDSLADSPITRELIDNDALIGEREGKAIPAWVLGQGRAVNGFDVARLRAAIAKARSANAGAAR